MSSSTKAIAKEVLLKNDAEVLPHFGTLI